MGIADDYSLDRDISREMVKFTTDNSLDNILEGITSMGDNRSIMGYSLLLMSLGNDSLADTGKLTFFSFLASQTLTGILKYSVNWDRPYGESESRFDSSFPSGHTSGTFAFVSVIGYHYPKYRVPLYLFATMIGLTRIALNEHYPSDVLAGASIGIISGLGVCKYRTRLIEFRFF